MFFTLGQPFEYAYGPARFRGPLKGPKERPLTFVIIILIYSESYTQDVRGLVPVGVNNTKMYALYTNGQNNINTLNFNNRNTPPR